MAKQRLFKLWCALLAATLVGVTICIRWLDIPVALLFLTNENRVTELGAGLGSAVLVAGEMLLIAGLAITRMARGTLPEFAKALFVACCASLSAFAANEYVLKLTLDAGIHPCFLTGSQATYSISSKAIGTAAFLPAIW
jgi:hypothetical protein